MIQFKTACDTRRQKKDGTSPVVFRITVSGSMRAISSGISIKPTDWDSKKSAVKEKSDQLKTLAKRLKSLELYYLNKIHEFELKYPVNQQVQTVLDYLCDKKKDLQQVREFWLEETNRLHRGGKHSNAIHLEMVLQRLEKLVNLNIKFQTVNYSWLTELETRLQETDIKQNSVSVYLRAFRSIYNKAINQELVDYSNYPFRRFKIKNGNSKPRTLTLQEMRQFFHYSPSDQKMKFAHDMGMLIFMLRGINHTDLLQLTKENVKKGRIIYERSKTHKLYSMELLPEAKAIIDYYHTNGTELLLNILTDAEYKDKKNLRMVIKQETKVLNKWLRRIGRELDITEPITTYTMRYSHANICRELRYSKDMISGSLGHVAEGARVTDAYLNDISVQQIDAMNRHVVQEVMKEGE